MVSALICASNALFSLCEPTSKKFSLWKLTWKYWLCFLEYYLAFWKLSLHSPLKNPDFSVVSFAYGTLSINLELEGQCGNWLSIQRGEAYVAPLQSALACVRVLPEAHLPERPGLSSEGIRRLRCRQTRVHRWQSKPSNSTDNLEMLGREWDESWNTSFSVNVAEDQVDEIEGKDEKHGRGIDKFKTSVFMTRNASRNGLKVFPTEARYVLTKDSIRDCERLSQPLEREGSGHHIENI